MYVSTVSAIEVDRMKPKVTAMTATTYRGDVSGSQPGSSFGGWLSRVFWTIVQAQEKEARRRVAMHFRGLDDEYLQKLGYSPADISRLRRG